MLPKHLDEKVARLQLAKIGAKLSAEQVKYLGVSLDGPYKSDQYRYRSNLLIRDSKKATTSAVVAFFFFFGRFADPNNRKQILSASSYCMS